MLDPDSVLGVKQIHGPVVAGSFYPAAAEELRNAVRSLLDTAIISTLDGRLVGLIVPHAALQYSGPVAATAYRLVEGGGYRRVVMLGPSHYSRFDGMATLPAEGWRTPLGVLEVERPAEDGRIAVAAEPYRREHCLEVQLPFLQETLPAATVTPVLFGRADPDWAGPVIDDLVESHDLLVVSSDLSHYLPHEDAVRCDRETATSIVARSPHELGPRSACGRRCIQAALTVARHRRWEVKLLDLRTSADTAGTADRVVGYGAFALLARA